MKRSASTPRLRASAIAVLAALPLAACGSATHSGATSSSAGTSTGAASASADRAAKSTPASASGGCAATVARTLGEVGERIYHQAATGTNVAQAVHRVQASDALASAITSGDANAARTALRALLVNQIVRIEIVRDGRVFATAGSGSAIAPVHGSIPDTGASFILSVQADHAYMQVAQQVTGAQILLLSGTRRRAGTIDGVSPASVPNNGALSVAGRRFQVFSLTGAAYPSGPLRIALLVSSSALSCPGSAAQARVETLGHVGERIYQEELGSSYVLETLHQIEADAGFQRAVSARDVAATRAAIVGFFAAHIHVVRVRVTVPDSSGGERLLIDLGGPYVLAPVHGTLRSGGKLVAHFTMAIQDDAGYLRLARLFTGAEVLMRTGGRQVMGTLSPGPASVPTDRGSASGKLSYRGHTYQAYSFTGEAFPSGPLRISLLIGS